MGHVARPRLTSRLESSAIGLVWAGGGWGKSALAAELPGALGVAAIDARLDPGDRDPDRLVGRLRRALRRAGRSDALNAMTESIGDAREAIEALADALAAEAEPVLLVVDDVHHADPAAAELLTALAADLPSQHRLLLLGRGPPPGLGALPDAVALDSTDLAFTAPEVAAIAGVDAGEAEALVRATGGWAAAVLLAVGGNDPTRALPADPREALSHLLRERLDTLAPDVRAGVIGLAHLPLLGDPLGVSGLMQAAQAVGLPLSRVRDGWWELAGGVQEFLAGLAPLSPETAESAAAAYLRAAEVRAAVTVLLRAGLTDSAAALVADLSPDRLDRLDHAELGALVDALPPAAVKAHPRVLVHLARACEPAAQLVRRTDALDRAEAAAGDDALLRRELDVERARDLVRDDRFEAADELAAAVLAQAGDDELATRARALDVRGRALALRGDEESLQRAQEQFEASAVLCRALGQRNWLAAVLLALADRVHFSRGQHALAVQRIDECLATLPARSRYRATTLSFRATTLIDCGRFAEAEFTFAEMRRLSEATGDERAAGYMAWTRAQLASYRGEAGPLRAALREAEDHSGEWFGHSTGAEFLAEAADLLDRVGEHERAGRYLERARERADEAGLWFHIAEAAVLARSGDPAEARAALGRAAALPRLPRREAWRIALLGAHVAARAGNGEDAGLLAAEAFEQAAAIGTPELPLVRERAIAAPLLEPAVANGSSAAARITAAEPTLEVTLLGGFAVTRGGTALELPEGRPQALVKLVAVAGGRLGADAAIEALWPGAPPEAGRKGLRNVLHRLRAAVGEVVVRDGETLEIAGGARIDAVAFERAATTAEDVGAVRGALAAYAGDLLPDDRYATWALRARERLRDLQVGLLDRLAEAVEADGELDEALRILERAIALDPHDERRYLLAARILAAQGRRGSALVTLTRGASVLRELGLPEPPAFAKLAQTLS